MNEFESWAPQEPAAGFADRVLAADDRRREQAQRRQRWRRVGAGAAGAVALAAAAALWWRGRPGEGEVIAEAERREVVIDGAVAVLEPGASIRWRGRRVEQAGGEVFYRVEPGGPYAVVTPAGTVDVGGTCFRVKVHAIDQDDGTDDRGRRATTPMTNSASKIGAGVIAGALLTVGVYEGRVRVSSAGEQRTLAAGDTATLGGTAARAGSQAGGNPGAPGGDARPGGGDDARMVAEANRNLVDWVQRLSQQISDAEEQKKGLERQLGQAQAALDRAAGKGEAKRSRSEYDLEADDWKELAEKGAVKFRVPCMRKPDWQPNDETLGKLGLDADDAPALKEAYQQSNARVWSTIRPLCVEALGSEAAVDRIGPDTCMHLVMDTARDKDRESWAESMRQVGELRAGLRPEPSEAIAQNPVYRIMTTMTGEAKQFEADLARQLGPDEAHRVTFSAELCAGGSTFTGAGPREPKK